MMRSFFKIKYSQGFKNNLNNKLKNYLKIIIYYKMKTKS